MWEQNYAPVGGSLGLSAAVAAIPILVLFGMLGIMRKPAWVAAGSGLVSALVLALLVYRMPIFLALHSTLFGMAFGMFPIAWIVFASIMLYRLAVDTGKFEIIKDSVGGLTNDRRLQALFIAFSFGAFIEGAAGFGAPVAVAGAMLAGLGFSPFYAAGICLLANTAPVAFGSIGTPVITLANVTALPVLSLSAMVGRLCAAVSVLIPGYLVVTMVGGRKSFEVWPAILVAGLSFASVQLFVSNHLGPELADILSSLFCIACMVVVLKLWKPATIVRLEGDQPITTAPKQHSTMEALAGWSPYLVLVIVVLIWGTPAFKAMLDGATTKAIPVPGLHNAITRVPPVTAEPSPYAAVFTLNWLTASGTACFIAAILSAVLLRMKPSQFVSTYRATFKQLAVPMATISLMLGLAYLMNYSGMTSTLGLSLAHTGKGFPFFSAVLGWLGVFLTGSVTSANALFGNLQVVTANALGLNPVLTAAVNSSAGVMGKMISLQSIAVAVAATGLALTDEGKLFRFTVKHSVFLMILMGIMAMLYAYAFPGAVPVVAAQ